MRINGQSRIFVTLLVAFSLAGRLPAAVELAPPSSGASAAFPLVAAGAAAPIVLPPDAPEVVKIAAGNLADDIAAVSGRKPAVLAAAPAGKNHPRVELVLASGLAGKWEAFRLSAEPGVLT